jgi:hypothetical protein
MALAPTAPSRLAAPKAWSRGQRRLLALVLIGTTALLRAWILLGGGFNGDSLVAVGSVALGVPSPQVASAASDLFTHAGLALDPGAYWPLALSLLILWLIYTVAVVLLVREVAGSPGRRLALLTFLLVAPLTLSGTSTWPLGVQWTTLAIGVVLVTYGAARFLTTGRIRDSWSMALGTVVALAGAPGPLWSAALLVPLWGVALLLMRPDAWLRFPAGGGGPSTRNAAIASAFMVALAGVWIAMHGQMPFGPLPRDLGRVAGYLGDSLGSGLSAVIGGPLAWGAPGPTWPTADAPVWATVLAIQILLLALASSLLITRRGLGLWGLGTAFIALAIVFASLATPVHILGLGSQLLALAAAPAMLVPAILSATLSPAITWPKRWPSGSTWLIGFVAIDVLIAASVVSTIAWADSRPRYPGQDYVAAATASLSTATLDVTVLPQVVPPSVADPAWAPLNRTDVILTPFADRPVFAPWTSALQAFDEEGTLRPARLAGITVRPTCTSWAPEIILDQPLPEFTYVVALNLAEPARRGLSVSLGDGEAVVVPADDARTRIFVQVTGEGAMINVTPLGDAPVCPTFARIGQAEAIPSSGIGESA